jgi:hypothetical protein
MNKILFTIFLFPVLLFAQDTCQITGTVYLVDGKTPFANGRIFVTRADKSGSLFLNTSKTYRTNASGVVTFSAPRTTGTDTAYVTVRSDFGNLTTEEILAVPDAATANLATLAGVNRYSTSTVLVPYGQFYVGRGNDTARVMYTLALAGGIGMQIDAYGRPQLFLNSDSLATGSGVTVGVLSDSLDANPRGGGGGISASELSDSLDADPRYRIDITARNITAGKADADSVSQQITLVKNMLDTKGDSDSLAWVADTAKAGNLAANTARAVADAHALRTDNPHTVTAAQLGALTSESDPTAAAKAQTVVSDTIDVIVPRTGIVVTSRLADSLAARALAVGDSLLAMRGFVRSAIADTLDLFSRGWMAGDTAVVGPDLDAMYARSGGSSVDTTQLLPKYGNTKTVLGNLGFGDKPTVNWSFIGKSSGAKIQMWDFNTQLLGLYGCSAMKERYCGYEVFQMFSESFTRTFGSQGADSTKRAHHQVIRANNPSSYVTSFEYGQQSFLHLTPVGVNVWQPKSNFHVRGGVRSDTVITPIIVKDDGSPVHIPSVKSDSLISRIVVIDSTGWIVLGDSAMYRITEIGHPKYHPLNPYKSGWIKIQTLFSPSGGTGIRRFKLIADSANNVRMYAIVSTHWQGHVASLCTGIGYTNIGYSPYWVATNTTGTTQYGVYTVVPANGYNSLSYADLALNITMFTDAGINGEIIVHYHLPAAATSTFYIKMEL